MTTFSSDRLQHQFVLSCSRPVAVPGWHNHQLGDFFLTAHRSLPVRAVVDRDGQSVGWALGWVIESERPRASGPLRLPVRVTVGDSRQMERAIFRFGGRFAIAILDVTAARVYLDPAGSLAAVYSPSRRRVASTVAAMLLDEPDHPLWTMAPGVFPDDRPNQYWPAGETIDPGIHRLLPNHLLDLSTWRTRRHHPESGQRPVRADEVDSCVGQIADRLRRNIGWVVQAASPVYLPLTAGQDSRVLLACSRKWQESIEYVTFDYSESRTEKGDAIDLATARLLAGRFRLRHRVIPVQRTLPEGTQLDYLRRIGFAGGAGKSWDFFASCQQNLDLSGAWLTGFAGEAGRAYYWGSGDSDAAMSAAELLGRLRLPPTEEFIAATDEWCRTLPDPSNATLLDLAYLEHRVGCWACPHLYGAAAFAINMTPFSDRQIFDPMLRLPVEYRRRRALAADIIKSAWPELLEVPFNAQKAH